MENGTKNKKSLPLYFTHNEAIRLIEAARELKTRSQFKSNLISLSMQFQYYCGLRISEVLSVTPSDVKIDQTRAEVLVKGKGHKQRIVPIVNREFLATIKYLNNDGLDLYEPYINKSRKTMWRWYKKVAANMDVYINTHMFRHSFARNLLLKHVPINTISLLLGHAYLSTTIDKYLQLVPSSEELERAWTLLNEEEKK
tara:strand:- start:58 stop:651 length:594 start_codon:yes stop_codon:yes gene_type:complete